MLHIDPVFLLVVCVTGAVKLPKYRKKGAGIPRIENVVLYKNRIGDSGAEAFAEGNKKKTMSLNRVLCLVLEEDGPLMRLLFVVFVVVVVACGGCLWWLFVVVACSVAHQPTHSNNSFVPQHDYDHGIQSVVCGCQITKDWGPH